MTEATAGMSETEIHRLFLEQKQRDEAFRRTAPKWNCVDYPDGMHYTPGAHCLWCGKNAEQIRQAGAPDMHLAACSDPFCAACLATIAANESKTRVLAELASFAHYPPEENSRDGKCLWCDFPVAAHHGLVVLGHDASGTFAGHLHRGCAAEVGRLQS